MDEADTTCWTYHCQDGPAYIYNGPSDPPTEDGVACMNDALASGKTAFAGYGRDKFNPWSTTYTYMFAVDHEVHVFTSFAEGPEDPQGFEELSGCNGPFRVGPAICGYMDRAPPYGPISVFAPTACP